MDDIKIKRKRFLKIAEARTNKIIDMIRLLGNCSNKNNYTYTRAEVKKIYDAIEKELKLSRAKFEDNQKESKFSLGGNEWYEKMGVSVS